MSQTLDPTCATGIDDGPDPVIKAPRTPGAGACPNCGSGNFSGATWCKNCGYYALLGKCVELAEWEKDFENGQYVGRDDEPAKVWLGVPVWMWPLAAVLLGIAAITFAARWYTPADSTPRSLASFLLAGGGLLALLAAHVRVTMATLARNKNLELAELVMSPMRAWIDAIMIQHSFRWLILGTAGIWATLLAHVFLGVPYHRIIRFRSDPAPKRTTSIAKIAPKPAASSEPMTLEEAMESLADSAGVDQLASDTPADAAPAKDESKPPTVTKQIDCLIVGYLPDRDTPGRIAALVVAEQSAGQWRVIGTVSRGMTPDLERDFLTAAQSLGRERPFVECNYPANWLEPVLRCQIQAELAEGQDSPSNLELLKLL